MRWPYLLLTLAYCAGIWWISSRPDVPESPFAFPGQDKVAHAVIYGGLAGVVYLGLCRSGRYRSPRLLFWVPVAFAFLYGILDEWHQSFVPPREPSAADILADTVGALLVMTLAYALRRRRLLTTDSTAFPD